MWQIHSPGKPSAKTPSFRVSLQKSLLGFWYRRLFCLHDSIRVMAVLREGSCNDCSHRHLRSGLLVGEEFWAWAGDDVHCHDCLQVWAATEESDYFHAMGADRDTGNGVCYSH